MSAKNNKEILRNAKKGYTFSMGSSKVTFLLTGEETDGNYSITEFTVAPPPYLGPPMHIHSDTDEACYILEGELHFVVGEQTMIASPGSLTYIPRGTPHMYSNAGPGSAKLLKILAPAGFEKYWLEMASLLNEFSGNPDPADIFALQSKYHMYLAKQVR